MLSKFTYCNLGRIASKVSKFRKVHLIYSLMLSCINYCDAFFYNLPENLLHAAVRFIFGHRTSALRTHMLMY